MTATRRNETESFGDLGGLLSTLQEMASPTGGPLTGLRMLFLFSGPLLCVVAGWEVDAAGKEEEEELRRKCVKLQELVAQAGDRAAMFQPSWEEG